MLLLLLFVESIHLFLSFGFVKRKSLCFAVGSHSLYTVVELVIEVMRETH